MGAASRIWHDFVDALSLRTEERRVRALGRQRASQVRDLVRVAALRIDAAHEIASPARAFAVVSLAREGLGLLVAAHRVSHGSLLSDATDALDDPASALEAMSRETGAPESWLRASRVLRLYEPLAFDRKPARELVQDCDDLFEACDVLRARLDVRSLAWIRGTRFGRMGAGVLAVALAILLLVRAFEPSRNLSQGASTTLSTRARGDSADAKKEVWQTLDLREVYRIESIRLPRIAVSGQKPCMPIAAELSQDGARYARIEFHDDHRGGVQPWEVLAGDQPARFVRVGAADTCALMFMGIEVMGRRGP